jgi:hypothetical protein
MGLLRYTCSVRMLAMRQAHSLMSTFSSIPHRTRISGSSHLWKPMRPFKALSATRLRSVIRLVQDCHGISDRMWNVKPCGSFDGQQEPARGCFTFWTKSKELRLPSRGYPSNSTVEVTFTAEQSSVPHKSYRRRRRLCRRIFWPAWRGPLDVNYRNRKYLAARIPAAR